MTVQYLFPCFFDKQDCKVDKNKLLTYVYKHIDSGINVSNVGGYQSFDIDITDENLQELVSLIKTNANNLCEELKVKNQIKISSMWFNVNKKGNYNNAHSHSGFISGIFYLKTNQKSGKITFRHPSQLHPYFMKDVKVEQYHPAIANEWFFDPSDCEMYLFPSYLEHYVLPNQSEEDRVSFAFNIDII